MRERMLMEPEIKFTKEEEMQLNKLVKQHNERYRSVNFGEELIKEMIMCRSVDECSRYISKLKCWTSPSDTIRSRCLGDMMT